MFLKLVHKNNKFAQNNAYNNSSQGENFLLESAAYVNGYQRWKIYSEPIDGKYSECFVLGWSEGKTKSAQAKLCFSQTSQWSMLVHQDKPNII